MRILVLGAAAGGGFPQWNCNCPNCRGLREHTIRATPRTQSSIAVSRDGVNWALVNASPDVLAQIKASPQLQPARKMRDSGIRAVIVVDSQIDHTTGLAMLREGERLNVHCTASVYEDLTSGNPVLRMLESYCGVEWYPLRLYVPFTAGGVEGVEFTPIAVQSMPPPYSPHRGAPRDDDNIALLISDTASNKRALYAPGLGAITPPLWQHMQQADCLLVDGTFWSDDEMIRLGVGRKRAREMGHLAQSGPDGMLSYLRRLSNARKVLVHINNTNPILNDDSVERRELQAAGVELAYDGLEIML